MAIEQFLTNELKKKMRWGKLQKRWKIARTKPYKESLYGRGFFFLFTHSVLPGLKNRFPLPYPLQLLISVPKHIFRNAVDRNLLKRRIREAFRRNKQALYEFLDEHHVKVLVCFGYSSKEILPFNTIQDKIILLLQRLMDENEETHG